MDEVKVLNGTDLLFFNSLSTYLQFVRIYLFKWRHTEYKKLKTKTLMSSQNEKAGIFIRPIS